MSSLSITSVQHALSEQRDTTLEKQHQCHEGSSRSSSICDVITASASFRRHRRHRRHRPTAVALDAGSPLTEFEPSSTTMLTNIDYQHQQTLLTAASVDPNAATAAASAFNRRGSQHNLSSAAAAAALKARPTTPINVAAVETKRTRRRSASQSSRTSLDAGWGGGGSLRRTPSTGSLTERTFRSPSPHRSPPPKAHVDAPPVPSIPAEVKSTVATTSAKNPNRRRAVSLQTPPLKLASQTLKEGHGSWYGPAAVGDPSNVRTADNVLKDVDLRPGSPSPSFNFSYPRGVRVSSPTEPSAAHEAMMRSMKGRPSSTYSDKDLVFDPNSRRMVTRAELLAREQVPSQPSHQPARRKKKQSPARTGSHLAHGTVARATGTALESDTETAPPRPVSPQSPHSRQAAEAPELVSTQMYDDMGAEIVVEPETRQSHAAHFGNEGLEIGEEAPLTLHHQGGKFHAVSHPERQEPGSGSQKHFVIHEIAEGSSSQKPAIRPLETVSARPPAHAKTQSPIELPTNAPDAEAATSSRSTSIATDPSQAGDARVSSRSPPRTTRFASPGETLTVPIRHSPPPRSVSPRKSALKQSASPNRGLSSSDETSETSGEASVLGSSQQEQPAARKKSVRVSFDDGSNVVVGEGAPVSGDDLSPVLHSPQTKRPWFNLGRRNKDIYSLDDEEDVEVMSPRPALPSFGSFREKKVRETGESKVPDTEERPLVRPREPAYSPPHSVSPARLPTIPSIDTLGSEYIGSSSDHAVGALLAEGTERNEAYTSGFGEPLPPEVTSVEGSGYVSMSSTTSSPSTSDDEGETTGALTATVLEPEPPMRPERVGEKLVAIAKPANGSTKHATTDESDSDLYEDADTPKAVPHIEFTLPTPISSPKVSQQPAGVELTPKYKTPQPEAEVEKPTHHFDVPGRFPEEESDDTQTEPDSKHPISPQPEAKMLDSHVPTIDTPWSSNTGKGVATILEEDSDSDTSAIYSDAYEDLSDMEGDGFLSLDAVVESPVSPKVSQKLYEKALSSSSKDKSAQDPQQARQLETTQHMEVKTHDEPPKQEPDWEYAKAYWRGLTAEKRRQLEVEAVEEAGQEGDLDDLRKSKKKAKKKKSIERKMSDVKMDPKMTGAMQTDRVYQIHPGTKVADEIDRPAVMRTTMRHAEPQAMAEYKRSLRGSHAQPVLPVENGRLRKSMRGPQAASVAAPVVKSGPALRQSTRSDRPASSAAPPAQTSGSMKKSLRSPAPGPPVVAPSDSGIGMRRTLRSGTSTQVSNESERSGVAKGGRPLSFQAPGSAREVPTLRKRNLSVDETPPKSLASFRIPLRRHGSDSSESSFKRSRPKPLESLGLRKTMRVDSPQKSPSLASDTSKKGGRFRLRSLSPTRSPFRRNSAVSSPAPPVSLGNHIRTTLRSDSSDNGSTHRMRIPSFGRHKQKKKKAKEKGIFASRFNDSSDDDVPAAPVSFKSRFAASSDEDEADVTRALPAVKGSLSAKTMRGGSKSAPTEAPAPAPTNTSAGPPTTPKSIPTPVQEEEEESESLPDSSDDEEKREEALALAAAATSAPQPDGTLRRKRSGRGALGSGASSPSPALGTQAMGMRPGHQRRGSLMAVLRRKKADPAGKIKRPERMDSAARRDTKLERSTTELEALRASSTTPRQQGRPIDESTKPSSPRLEDDEDDSDESDYEDAPAEPIVSKEAEQQRPATSSGPTPTPAEPSTPKKPILGRRSTSHGILGLGKDKGQNAKETDPRKKKKKFQTLRKMFGIDD